MNVETDVQYVIKKTGRNMVSEIASAAVVVLDRHPLFRLGAASLLRDAHPGWDCVEGEQLDDVHHVLMENDPAVVLVDPLLPEIVDMGGLQELIAEFPQHLFIATSDNDDRTTILGCLTAGARGYILRSTNTTQFLRAIETVISGGVFAPASLTGMAMQRSQIMVPTTGGAPLANLTDRQRDVFNLLAEGCATKTIARRLDLAVGTVKVHLAAIYRALGANSRLEAVAKAHRHGLHG